MHNQLYRELFDSSKGERVALGRTPTYKLIKFLEKMSFEKIRRTVWLIWPFLFSIVRISLRKKDFMSFLVLRGI